MGLLCFSFLVHSCQCVFQGVGDDHGQLRNVGLQKFWQLQPYNKPDSCLFRPGGGLREHRVENRVPGIAVQDPQPAESGRVFLQPIQNFSGMPQVSTGKAAAQQMCIRDRLRRASRTIMGEIAALREESLKYLGSSSAQAGETERKA